MVYTRANPLGTSSLALPLNPQAIPQEISEGTPNPHGHPHPGPPIPGRPDVLPPQRFKLTDTTTRGTAPLDDASGPPCGHAFKGKALPFPPPSCPQTPLDPSKQCCISSPSFCIRHGLVQSGICLLICGPSRGRAGRAGEADAGGCGASRGRAKFDHDPLCSQQCQ